MQQTEAERSPWYEENGFGGEKEETGEGGKGCQRKGEGGRNGGGRREGQFCVPHESDPSHWESRGSAGRVWREERREARMMSGWRSGGMGDGEGRGVL